MKHSNKILGAMLLATAALATSCVDDDKLGYAFEKPASIAGMEYLADYDALKTYVNRSEHPNFKLGVALAASDYNADGLVTRLANSNYDEMTAGNAMKYASCVKDDGKMDFGTVEAFVNNAKENGIKFTDLNLNYKDFKLDFKEDTCDEGDHLNVYGATKVSEYLGKYINDNYKFDKHDEKLIARWNKDLETYKNDIKELEKLGK